MEPTQGLPDCCEHCDSLDIHVQPVRSAFWHEERLIVIEDIPALVCGNCHEQFYDDRTVMLIDRMRGEGFPPERARSELRVPVFAFGDRLDRREAP